MDYTNLNKTRSFVQTLTSTSGNKGYLDALLEATALENSSGVTHYRPYEVAALVLEQQLQSQQLSKADDVEFTGYRTPIDSFNKLQYDLDLKLGLKEPEGTLKPGSVTVNYSTV
jgi:hypothetical protein